MTQKIVLGAGFLIVLSCLILTLIVINTGITVPQRVVPTISSRMGCCASVRIV